MLHASVSPTHWRVALQMATDYLMKLRGCSGLSADFAVCLDALAAHLDQAAAQIARLA